MNVWRVTLHPSPGRWLFVSGRLQRLNEWGFRRRWVAWLWGWWVSRKTGATFDIKRCDL